MFQLKRFLIVWFLRPLFIRLGISKFSKVGLNGLDDKLAPYLNFRNGFFVELGANDGILQSNTFYLEKLKGWRGILIEPLPRLYRKAKRNRRNSQVINAACVPFDYDQPYIEIKDLGLMSFVEGALNLNEQAERLSASAAVDTVKVQTQTLNDILINCNVGQIDFMSIDVEGYEADVLYGLDLERFKPRYILVEARYRDEVEKILSPFYDVEAQLTHHDVLYKRKPEQQSKRSPAE